MATAAYSHGRINKAHRRCFACGAENDGGLGLEFVETDDGRVRAECVVSERYQGYPGVVQGGIVATILDCAMTNCLFLRGIEAMTARLNVRFHEPVVIGERLTAEAVMTRRSGRVYELEANISQGGLVKASAGGTFMVTRDDV